MLGCERQAEREVEGEGVVNMGLLHGVWALHITFDGDFQAKA